MTCGRAVCTALCSGCARHVEVRFTLHEYASEKKPPASQGLLV